MMDDTDPTLREVAELLRNAAAKLDTLAAAAATDVDVGTASAPAPLATRARLLERLRELARARREEQERADAVARAQERLTDLQRQRDAAAEQMCEAEASLVSEETLAGPRQDSAEDAAAARTRLAEIEAAAAAAAGENGEARDRHAQARANLERTLHEVRTMVPDASVAPENHGGAPVRVLALLALKELGAPAPSSLLGDYIAVRFGRAIRADRWGALRRDERKAWDSARRRSTRRTAWLCPALDGDSGEAVTSLWTRGDWPITLRVVLEGDQTLHLRLLYRLGLLAIVPPPDTSDVGGLRRLASDHLQEEFTSLVDGPTAEEALASSVLTLHDLLRTGDNSLQVRAHDPDSDRPAAPDWFDDLNLPDSDVERLFGRDEDVPF